MLNNTLTLQSHTPFDSLHPNRQKLQPRHIMIASTYVDVYNASHLIITSHKSRHINITLLKQSRAKQSRAKQSKANQREAKAKQRKAKQQGVTSNVVLLCSALLKQSKAKQSRAEQSKAKQSKKQKGVTCNVALPC